SRTKLYVPIWKAHKNELKKEITQFLLMRVGRFQITSLGMYKSVLALLFRSLSTSTTVVDEKGNHFMLKVTNGFLNLFSMPRKAQQTQQTQQQQFQSQQSQQATPKGQTTNQTTQATQTTVDSVDKELVSEVEKWKENNLGILLDIIPQEVASNTEYLYIQESEVLSQDKEKIGELKSPIKDAYYNILKKYFEDDEDYIFERTNYGYCLKWDWE
ncbi:MAG: hypothetical protein ACI4HM_05165, partial [Ruminococcus sp.]